MAKQSAENQNNYNTGFNEIFENQNDFHNTSGCQMLVIEYEKCAANKLNFWRCWFWKINNGRLLRDEVDEFLRSTSEEHIETTNLKNNILKSGVFTNLIDESLSEIDQIKKVFIGKILARIFLLIQTKSEKLSKYLIRDIKKDILDFEYYS